MKFNIKMDRTKINYLKVSLTTVLLTIVLLIFFAISASANSNTITVNSLAEFRSAVQQSNQTIVMEAGNYFLEDLASNSRVINCSGSNNTIDLTGVRIKTLVGCIRETYFIISGDDNKLINGAIEDYYKNGQSDDITDYSAYNDNPDLAYGLKGAAVMSIYGNNNLVSGIELIVRGSDPYGYGSIYGIGKYHTFSLNKRCGLLISGGDNNTLDGVTMHQNAFGHGIYIQNGADGSVIKNCHVEGRMRLSAELYNETKSYDLPFISDYKLAADGTSFDLPFESPVDIPLDIMYPLSEDGIRAYSGTGSVTVENCTVKQMRGGIRLYMASKATVTNCTSISCGLSNFNMPSGGTIINSSGNFAYAPMTDYGLVRNNLNFELTIIPSPYVTGSHNLVDLEGNNHTMVYHRTPGPLDTILRPIVVVGDNSTITNETEYPIILESSASGNTIVSCGPVTDNGTNNKITQTTCTYDAFSTIEAEDYTAMSGVETTATTDEGSGNKISSIDANDWMEYEITIPLAGSYSFDYRVSGISNGDFKVELNGETIDAITFNATGGNEIWETVHSASPINLMAGVDTIRIISNVAGWNLNWISLTAECYKSEITPRINSIDLQGTESGLAEQSGVTVFPGFSVSLNPLSPLGGSWNWTGPNGFSSADEVLNLTDIKKNQGGDYIATFTNTCGLESKVTFTVNVQDSLYIEAENHTKMSGVTLESTTDISGNSNVTSINTGDCIEYEVNVPFSGLYRFSYRVASENAGNFDVSVDSKEIDKVTFNGTGGSQTWATINSASTIYLKAGVQTLRISAKSDGWKLNWLELKVTKIVNECSLPYSNDGFNIKNETIEWTTGLMNITCETDVDIHVIMKGMGSLGELDYLNVYYKLDDGEPVIIKEIKGDIDEMMVSALELKGQTLELIIKSHSESTSKYYKISKIIIKNGTDPFARIEAEDYNEANGTQTENCSDTGGGSDVGSIKDDNWLMFRNLNLSEANSINMRLASRNSGGTIEVHLNSPTGTKIGTLEMPNTGDWQKWETVTGALKKTIGFYDVYLVFNSSASSVGNINWFEFSSTMLGTGLADTQHKQTPFLYPNPVDNKLTIIKNSGAQLEVYNQLGALVLKERVGSDQHVVSFGKLQSGFYVVRVLNDNLVKSYNVIKE